MRIEGEIFTIVAVWFLGNGFKIRGSMGMKLLPSSELKPGVGLWASNLGGLK
jgi:hypothetical protein